MDEVEWLKEIEISYFFLLYSLEAFVPNLTTYEIDHLIEIATKQIKLIDLRNNK